jgi:hypothetical protein
VQWGKRGIGNGGATGIFDVEDRLRQLSAKGDALERLSAVVILNRFVLILTRRLCARINRGAAGRRLIMC